MPDMLVAGIMTIGASMKRQFLTTGLYLPYSPKKYPILLGALSRRNDGVWP
jgi:hypothetical protein